MRRGIAIAVLLAAASWALLLWSAEQAPPAPLEPEESSEPVPVPSTAPVHAPTRPPEQPAPRPSSAEVAEPASTKEPDTTAQPQAAPVYKLPKLPPPQAQGPVSALKVRFGNASASEESRQQEQQLAELLRRTGPPSHSVADIVCRRSVCRIDWRWKAEHVIPFGQALGALHSVDPNPGVDAAGPANPDGTHPVEIYVDVAHR